MKKNPYIFGFFCLKYQNELTRYTGQYLEFLTSQNVDIIGPRSSLTIPTSVGFPVFAICQVTCLGRGAPSPVLHCEHSIASFLCSQCAFPSSVSPSAVMSF